MGTTYVELGRYSDASRLAQRLAHDAPDARYNINIMHRLAGKMANEEALKCLPTTGKAATDPPTVCNRIHLFTTLGRYAEALKLCLKAGGAFASKNKMFTAIAQCARHLPDGSESEELIAALQKERNPDWLVFFIAALIFEDQHRIEDAASAYEKAFQESGCSADVAAEYCDLLVDRKMYSQAHEVLQRVKTDRDTILPIEARVLVLLKKPKEALEIFQKSALQNHSPRSEALLGDLYRQLGRPIEALDHYNRAVQLDPKAKYMRQRRLNFARLIRKYDVVCEEIDNSLKTSPYNYRLYFQKALYEELSGHYNAATSAWNRALALKSGRR